LEVIEEFVRQEKRHITGRYMLRAFGATGLRLARAFAALILTPASTHIFAVAGGVPTKVIKYRYDEEDIQFLLCFKWWDRDIMWLKENADLLCDLDALKGLKIQ
jgi:hypothetical protein